MSLIRNQITWLIKQNKYTVNIQQDDKKNLWLQSTGLLIIGNVYFLLKTNSELVLIIS